MKVYAAARHPEAVALKGVAPLKLDVTSDEDVAAAANIPLIGLVSFHRNAPCIP